MGYGCVIYGPGGRQRDWHHPRAGFFLRHDPQERFRAQKINFCEHWAHSNATHIAHYGAELSTSILQKSNRAAGETPAALHAPSRGVPG